MNFLEMAAELAAARKAWATDFLLYRAMHADTDKKAVAMADVENIERLTMAEARYELAKWRLREDDHATPTSAPSADPEPAEATADEEGAVQDYGE